MEARVVSVRGGSKVMEGGVSGWLYSSGVRISIQLPCLRCNNFTGGYLSSLKTTSSSLNKFLLAESSALLSLDFYFRCKE